MSRKFRKLIMGTINQIYDICFITLMLLLLLLAIYARWDSQQVYTRADPVQFIQYKPSPPEMYSFEELQGINPDVLAWLTIYGTNIDYPVVQSTKDNQFYLNRNAMLETESSGSIFLDYRCNPDFKDFNTIIYGHHMEKHKMFGDLDEFLDEKFWNEHEFGNLIYDAQNHGIQFVAMIEASAYDPILYRPHLTGESSRVQYINHIYETAKYVRGVDTKVLHQMQAVDGEHAFAETRTSPLTPDDHILIFSTCSTDITNGRYILVAKLLDRPVENPFPDEKRTGQGIDTTKIMARIGKWSTWTWIWILIGLIILVLFIYLLSTYLYKRKLEGENADDQNEETL